MREEVLSDISNGELYISDRLNDKGKELYPKPLLKAIDSGNEETLALNLSSKKCMELLETRNTSSGTSTVKVPYNANVTLSEG